MDFAALGLDARVARAAARKFQLPTAVQAQAIPLALAGQDVIAQASTGSGKTAAYLLPCLHRLLTSSPEAAPGPRALVLVPTRELCQQVRTEAASLAAFAGGAVRVGQLPGTGAAAAALAAAAAAPPDLLVATPARVAQALRDGLFRPGALTKGLQFLVLDEADLLLSFGHEPDVAFLAAKLPRGVQCMLVSATCSGDGFDRLAGLVTRSAVRVEVSASGADNTDPHLAPTGAISHTVLRCAARDKLLHVLALLRLGKVRRKALLFVPTADAAVRLRLFLEKFGVRAGSLHAELPANSRAHVLQEFNKGLFDYLIATDDAAQKQRDAHAHAAADGAEEEDGAPGAVDAPAGSAVAGLPARKKGLGKDAEFGVMRGIDFKDVRTVLNVDLPPTSAAYVHRVGRCARGGASGTAITLVCPSEEGALGELASALGSGGTDGADGTGDGASFFAAFEGLPKDAVEALRYRAEDTARSLGRNAVREARLRELRTALLNSELLAAHFEDNPRERLLLASDAPLVKATSAPHLKHLPAYLRGSGGIKPPASRKRKADVAEAVARRDATAAAGAVAGAAAGAAAPAPAPADALLSRTLWAREDGPKKRRRGAGKEGGSGGTKAGGGPEWPTRGMTARTHTKNVRRGRRKSAR